MTFSDDKMCFGNPGSFKITAVAFNLHLVVLKSAVIFLADFFYFFIFFYFTCFWHVHENQMKNSENQEVGHQKYKLSKYPLYPAFQFEATKWH